MNRKAFFDAARPMFGHDGMEQVQVDRLSALLDELERSDLATRQEAYILATAFHETARFRYMREIWGPTKAQKGYDPPSQKAKSLGNTLKGDGKRFMGRGYVQITGRRNYADWGKRLGLDLVKEPHLAERSVNAAKIIVGGMMRGTFTGLKLPTYVTETLADYVNARKVVNGKDRADLIAGYARDFNAALLKAKAAKPPPEPVEPQKPVPAPAQPATPQPPHAGKPEAKAGVIGRIVAVIVMAGVAALGWLADLPCNWLGIMCGGN